MGAEEVRIDLEPTEMQSEAEVELPEVAATLDIAQAVGEAVVETTEPAVAVTDSTIEVDEVTEEIVAVDEASADDEEMPEEVVAVEAEVIEDEVEAVDAPVEPQALDAAAALAAEAELEAEDAVVVDEAPALDEAAEVDVEGEAEPKPFEIEAPGDGRAWYVIHCYSGYEAKVKHNLEQRIETMQMQDQIFQVVVPTEDEIEVRDGKRRVVERRVFPGYILVQMLLNDDSWYVVRNTPGVTGFVGMGNDPTPLRPEEVQGIMRRMEAEAPKIKVTFRQGQKVRIVDGPFNEFIGVVDEIDMERAKVRVLVSFFGRETPVELDFLQVEKA